MHKQNDDPTEIQRQEILIWADAHALPMLANQPALRAQVGYEIGRYLSKWLRAYYFPRSFEPIIRVAFDPETKKAPTNPTAWCGGGLEITGVPQEIQWMCAAIVGDLLSILMHVYCTGREAKEQE